MSLRPSPCLPHGSRLKSLCVLTVSGLFERQTRPPGRPRDQIIPPAEAFQLRAPAASTHRIPGGQHKSTSRSTAAIACIPVWRAEPQATPCADAVYLRSARHIEARLLTRPGITARAAGAGKSNAAQAVNRRRLCIPIPPNACCDARWRSRYCFGLPNFPGDRPEHLGARVDLGDREHVLGIVEHRDAPMRDGPVEPDQREPMNVHSRRHCDLAFGDVALLVENKRYASFATSGVASRPL